MGKRTVRTSSHLGNRKRESGSPAVVLGGGDEVPEEGVGFTDDTHVDMDRFSWLGR